MGKTRTRLRRSGRDEEEDVYHIPQLLSSEELVEETREETVGDSDPVLFVIARRGAIGFNCLFLLSWIFFLQHYPLF